jgi:hypothetical protein
MQLAALALMDRALRYNMLSRVLVHQSASLVRLAFLQKDLLSLFSRVFSISSLLTLPSFRQMAY